MAASCTAVLDVGKTHSKLTLWGDGGLALERRARAKQPVDAGDYRALDAVRIEAWAAETLRDLAIRYPIATIIPVGHGAAAAVLHDGRLAYPAIDYEQPVPAGIRARYDAERDAFGATGSPALPLGFNLGIPKRRSRPPRRCPLDRRCA